MRSLSREMTSELRNWEVGEIEGLRNWDSTVIIVLIFAINVYLFSNKLMFVYFIDKISPGMICQF